jgi:hypothetical protein
MHCVVGRAGDGDVGSVEHGVVGRSERSGVRQLIRHAVCYAVVRHLVERTVGQPVAECAGDGA